VARSGFSMGGDAGLSREAPGGLDGARLRLLLEGSVENLLASWSEPLALFPFSSRLHGGTIVHDYENPIAARYTINTLLGLLEAARSRRLGVSEADVHALAEAFLQRDAERVSLPADRGLATLLIAELDGASDRLSTHVRTLRDVLTANAPRSFEMQDLAWILWGAAGAARTGTRGAEDVVRRASGLITSELVDEKSGLPRHTAARHRRNVVSFGALVYFLRAMHEAAQTLGDERAQRLFDAGVARAVALQGPLGEWPWMIDSRTGIPFDTYPVFAVHQDSMAMLFLHPALDRGLPGAAEAISRSVPWVFGANELWTPMLVERPFFAYRSIERAERAPRLRRYLRSLGPRAISPVATIGAAGIRINDECRSYHLGWILYVWSNRPEAWAP
jgi:hypothetical protein